MPSEIDPNAFEKVLDLLLGHKVEFIVIGGLAEHIMGSPRVTYDVDICYRRTPDNLKRLAEALKQIKPTLRGASPELPFVVDAKTLAMGHSFTFETELIALDLLGWVEPIGSYDELLANAESHDYKGVDVKTISLDDLIRIKEHINRPKDQDSLFQLRAIKQVREEHNHD